MKRSMAFAKVMAWSAVPSESTEHMDGMVGTLLPNQAMATPFARKAAEDLQKAFRSMSSSKKKVLKRSSKGDSA